MAWSRALAAREAASSRTTSRFSGVRAPGSDAVCGPSCRLPPTTITREGSIPRRWCSGATPCSSDLALQPARVLGRDLTTASAKVRWSSMRAPTSSSPPFARQVSTPRIPAPRAFRDSRRRTRERGSPPCGCLARLVRQHLIGLGAKRGVRPRRDWADHDLFRRQPEACRERTSGGMAVRAIAVAVGRTHGGAAVRLDEAAHRWNRSAVPGVRAGRELMNIRLPLRLGDTAARLRHGLRNAGWS